LNPIVINCGGIEVEIEPQHGRILRLEDRGRQISLVGEKALAENFRLLLPLPDWEAHYIRGSDQPLADARVTPD